MYNFNIISPLKPPIYLKGLRYQFSFYGNVSTLEGCSNERCLHWLNAGVREATISAIFHMCLLKERETRRKQISFNAYLPQSFIGDFFTIEYYYMFIYFVYSPDNIDPHDPIAFTSILFHFIRDPRHQIFYFGIDTKFPFSSTPISPACGPVKIVSPASFTHHWSPTISLTGINTSLV